MEEKLKSLRAYLREKKLFHDYNKKISNILSYNDSADTNLTDDQIEEAVKFWDKFNIVPNLKWHKAYTAVDNKFDPKYIPEEIFRSLIEPVLVDLRLSQAHADKNMYDKQFPFVKQPETIIRNMNGKYYDNNYEYLKDEEVELILKNLKGSFIIKPTIGTGQGNGVNIIKFELDKMFLNDEIISIKELESNYKKDFIIQEKIIQNELINDIYPHSLNTFRITSLNCKNEISIVASFFRLGNDGLKVDNVHAGGLAVGINNDGKLKNFAIDVGWKKYYNHPYTNSEFSEIKIPKFNKAIKMVEKIHKNLFYFDMISCDLALNNEGEFVFIEVNLNWQDINLHQAINGSLFGDKTESIMNYVLKNSLN